MKVKTDFPARRVLVVDDDADTRRTLEMLLSACGQTVRCAPDGPAALALVASYHPELVLLDLGMPGMDGLEVARAIRRDGVAQPAIVAMTGHGQTEDRVATRDAGFDGHLVKPVTFNRLARILEAPSTLAATEPGAPLPLLRGSS